MRMWATSGSGTFNQSGGTSNIQSDSLGNGGNLFLGNNVGSNGSYNLGGPGVLSVSGTEYVGNLGPGTFSQSGGTNNAGGSYAGGIILGNNTAVSGSYSLSGSGLLAPTLWSWATSAAARSSTPVGRTASALAGLRSATTRASGRLLVLPPRLDQAPLGQPDQDRIQRA